MTRLVVLLSGFLFSASLCAAITYNYTGSLYTTIVNFIPPCTGGPCANFAVGSRGTGFFTIATSLGGNLGIGNVPPVADISSLVTSYSFNDGINTYTSADPNSRMLYLRVGTDASGTIASYEMVLQLWRTGSNPHAIGDHFSQFSIYDVTAAIGSGAGNNLTCATLQPDQTNACFTSASLFSELSQAESTTMGTWSVSNSDGTPIPTLSNQALAALALLITGMAFRCVRPGYSRIK